MFIYIPFTITKVLDYVFVFVSRFSFMCTCGTRGWTFHSTTKLYSRPFLFNVCIGILLSYPEWTQIHDLLASAFWRAGILGMCHHIQLKLCFFTFTIIPWSFKWNVEIETWSSGAVISSLISSIPGMQTWNLWKSKPQAFTPYNWVILTL